VSEFDNRSFEEDVGSMDHLQANHCQGSDDQKLDVRKACCTCC
jgi:hypothetical protein